MTDYKPGHLAKEAQRLKGDEIFNRALDDIKTDAFEALSRADINEPNSILRLQQKIAVIEEIRDTFDQWIVADTASN